MVIGGSLAEGSLAGPGTGSGGNTVTGSLTLGPTGSGGNSVTGPLALGPTVKVGKTSISCSVGKVFRLVAF
jgi:hypothetical protein